MSNYKLTRKGDGFMIQLDAEVAKFQDHCKKRDIQPVLRLNCAGGL